MPDDKTTDFKTGRPLPATNPTGVIEARTGRLFSGLDAGVLDEIEKSARGAELNRFIRANPEVVDHEVERLWVQVERQMEAGFYDRLARWIGHRSRSDADNTSDPIAHLPSTPNNERARRLARWVARLEMPRAWKEVVADLERNAEAWRAMQEEVRRCARAFAKRYAEKLNPTESDLNDLARRLFELVLLTTGETEDKLESAAKTNPILRSAMREFEAWHARLQDLIQKFGNGPEAQFEAKRQQEVTYGRTFAFHWPALLHAWELENAPRLGVARAIAGPLAKKDHAGAGAARIREAVANELARPEFINEVGWPWPEHHEEVEADGMAAPRARLLAYLRQRFCPRGEGKALTWIENLEVRGRASLAEWKKQERLEGIEAVSPWQVLTPSLAASLVAQVVWFDRVSGEVERESSSTAALVTTVSAGVGAIWAADTKQSELQLRGPDGSSVAWFVVGSADEEKAASLFGVGSTLTFHRLIRYLPRAAWELWRQTRRDQAEIVIEGGYSRLAELIGAPNKKATEEVRHALELGRLLRRQWADGSEADGLWTVISTPHAPGRPARLIITLSPVLRPGFAHRLPEGASKTLVPVVPFAPFTGRGRDHAKQAALQWVTMERLAAGRAETANEGGVTFTDADWRRLAERTGLPSSTIHTVRDAWEGVFLERVGADRWFLANTPDFAPARAHLLDQAQLAATGALRGRAGAAKKRGATQRKRKQPKQQEK